MINENIFKPVSHLKYLEYDTSDRKAKDMRVIRLDFTAGRIIRRKFPVSPIVHYEVAALPFILYLAELRYVINRCVENMKCRESAGFEEVIRLLSSYKAVACEP
jgi:hypothetical protein